MTERLDQETRDAITALAHRLHAWDQAPAGERQSVEDFAHEFVLAMRNRGWRVTEARVMPVWTLSPGRRGADPKRHEDELRQVRAACERAVAKHRAASAREDREGGEES